MSAPANGSPPADDIHWPAVATLQQALACAIDALRTTDMLEQRSLADFLR